MIRELVLVLMLGVTMQTLRAFAPRTAVRVGSRASSLSMMAKKKRSFPENPVAVVTGASRGIGKAIAMELGKAGCKVVVNYASSAGPAEEVVNEIKAMGNGADAIAIKANIGDVGEIRALFGEAEEKLGPVNICVNNAGITNDMLVMMMKPEDFTGVIDINLNGVFYASQAAFASMMPKKIGRIINVASIVGQIGNPGQSNYAAAKGGVIGMTKAMAKEFGGRGVTVNAVCPGFIASDMTKDLDTSALLPMIPLKRLGEPHEVAGLVKFLALDPASAYITGHCFNVDGGMAIGAT
jgi:3-oxoacyl-[acyl-carrier protein] reductase